MSAPVWQTNDGRMPTREFGMGPAITHVFVRLRNGIQPPQSWPVDTGRAQSTRWSLTGDAFDITHWRAA